MSPIVKRKKISIKIQSKHLLLIMTVICCVLMFSTMHVNYSSIFTDSIIGRVVVPIQNGVTSLGNWFIDKSDSLAEISDLIEENKRLNAEIADLTIENDQLNQDVVELDSLRELYKLDKQYVEYEKVGARVIGSDSSNWFSTFTIDKGLDDGLLINMNVIADGGLVGRIDRIGSNWARVSSIINDSMHVSGMVLSTSDNMMVSGKLELIKENMIEFSQLYDEDNSVSIGDKIITSNISDKYLPGIAIGFITEIEMDSNNLTKSGTLEPVVDFKHIKEVLVIKQLKQSVDKME